MDYSLLLVIEKNTSSTNKNVLRGSLNYRFSIIDFLENWRFEKKTEGLLKEKILNLKGVSAVHPKLYSSRFENFVMNTVF